MKGHPLRKKELSTDNVRHYRTDLGIEFPIFFPKIRSLGAHIKGAHGSVLQVFLPLFRSSLASRPDHVLTQCRRSVREQWKMPYFKIQLRQHVKTRENCKEHQKGLDTAR